MKKEILETFIKRYSLNGLVPKVKWKFIPSQKTLHTRSAIDNKSFMVDVIMNEFSEFGAEDLMICIGDTDKVKAMMTPFDEEFDVTINKNGDRLLGFTLSNNDIECYCTAADPSAIDPVAKNLQDLPDSNVEIPLSEEFIEKFLKSRSALKDVDSMTVGMNKANKFEIIIGYSTANSNRIRITPITDPVKNTIGDKKISFPLKNIIESIKVNEDIPNGIMSVSDIGIVKLYFKNDKFACTYFQFCNKTK